MQTTPKTKTVGVLGGMGPYATLAFFKALLDQTPAKKDWEHLRVIIDDNPHIPSRTRYLLYKEDSPFDGMLESCKKLQQYPVDFIAVPCNSAAIFVPELQARIDVPILNICEVTANALAVNYPQAKRVAVLGAYVTYTARVYERFLADHSIALVDHGSEMQEAIVELIEELKLGNSNANQAMRLQALLRRLKSDLQVDAAVLGCTELNCLPAFESDIPLVDSNLELARSAVSLARRIPT
jgi:aspartate racemase